MDERDGEVSWRFSSGGREDREGGLTCQGSESGREDQRGSGENLGREGEDKRLE